MSLNSIIMNTLAPTNVPVAFRVYKGTETTYIRFFEVVDVPSLHAENEVKNSMKTIQIDIFSKGNYASLIKETKSLMKSAGFLWRDSRELYEEDTGYFHYAITYNKSIKLEN